MSSQDYEGKPLGTGDAVLFSLVIVASISAGIFQGWFQTVSHSSSRPDDKNQGLSLPQGRGPLPDLMFLLTICCSVALTIGLPTHVFSFGASLMSAAPAVILAQVSALCLVLPVFGGSASRRMSRVVENGTGTALAKQKLSFETYLHLRFHSQLLSILSAVLFYLLWILFSAVTLYGVACIFKQITPFGSAGSIVCTIVIATIFTMLEGKPRLLWTDVLLSAILVGGLVAILVKCCLESGGISAVLSKARAMSHFKSDSFSFDPTYEGSYVTAFFGHFIIWLCVYGGFYASDNRSRKISSSVCVAILHTPVMMLLLFVLVMIGLIMATIIHPENPCLGESFNKQKITWPDQILPNFVVERLGIHHGLTGFPGLFLAIVTAHAFSMTSTGFTNLLTKLWNYQDQTNCLGGSGSANKFCSQLFVRMLASASTLLSGALIFAMEGTYIYQTLLSSTGIILGVLLAIYLLGLLVPFANGRAVFLAALVSLAFGHWISIGGMAFSPRHPPVQHLFDRCNNIINENSGDIRFGTHHFPSGMQFNSGNSLPSFASGNAPPENQKEQKVMNPLLPSAKDDFPSHILVSGRSSNAGGANFMDKQSNTQPNSAASQLPRSPVSNFMELDQLTVLALSQVEGKVLPLSSSSSSGMAGNAPASQHGQQQQKRPRTPITVGNIGPSTNTGPRQGNKPPLILARPEDENGLPINPDSGTHQSASDTESADANITHHTSPTNVNFFYRISYHLYGLIGFLFTLFLGTLFSLVSAQVASGEKSLRSFVEPSLLHPWVRNLCGACLSPTSMAKPQGDKAALDRRRSHLVASIEDSAAEAAETAAQKEQMLLRHGSVNRSKNASHVELERRLSRHSRRSQRSSLGGQSANSHSPQAGTTTTTTAEVLVTVAPNGQDPRSADIERRLSQLSNEEVKAVAATAISELTRRNSGSFRDRNRHPGFHRVGGSGAALNALAVPAMVPSMVPEPSPVMSLPSGHQKVSPKTSLLLAPPTEEEQIAQRRFSEVNAAIERHNSRRAAKRSQSVMYRQKRRSNKNRSGSEVCPDDVEMYRRTRSSVKM